MGVLKYVVVDAPLSEVEVHPPDSYDRLVEVSTEAAAQLDKRHPVACPGCDRQASQPAFEMHGYAYVVCDHCASLYATPRPDAEAMHWYLHESPAAEFRQAEYRRPLEQRAHEEALTRADWVQEILRAHGLAEKGSVVDLHSRSPEFLQALSDQGLDPVLAIDPLTPSQASQADGDTDAFDTDEFDTDGPGTDEPRGLSQLPAQGSRMVTAFNVLEHLADVGDAFSGIHRALADGGLLALTSRSASGLDIQVLWQHCPTIFPADHLNLLSVEGIRQLLERLGFEVLEISTPGQLDVELVERVLGERDDVDAPRFLRYLLAHRDHQTKARLQQFLQQHLLSSHLRVVARKLPTPRPLPSPRPSSPRPSSQCPSQDPEGSP